MACTTDITVTAATEEDGQDTVETSSTLKTYGGPAAELDAIENYDDPALE